MSTQRVDTGWSDSAHLADVLPRIVRTVASEVRPKLIRAALSGNRGENVNERHADNFLSDHDLWMHDRYRELLAAELGSFVYASEEAEPDVVGTDGDPDLCVLVDPLDTSELAVRGLNGYTQVLAYSRSLRRPVGAVVGDLFHHVNLYAAFRHDDGEDRTYLATSDGQRHPLTAPRSGRLSAALVTNFFMRPTERFLPLLEQQALLRALSEVGHDGKSRGRIGLDFGSVGLCHVAAGFTDAFVEFAKGFALWDLAPGQYVLKAAGGCVLGLDGQELPLDLGLTSLEDIRTAMERRQKFIAAGSADLAQELLRAVEGP